MRLSNWSYLKEFFKSLIALSILFAAIDASAQSNTDWFDNWVNALGPNGTDTRDQERISLKDIWVVCLPELRSYLPPGEADRALEQANAGQNDLMGYRDVRWNSSNKDVVQMLRPSDSVNDALFEGYRRQLSTPSRQPGFVEMQICAIKRRLCQVGRTKYCMGRPYTGTSVPVANPAPTVLPAQNIAYPPDLPPVPMGTEAERKAVFTADDYKSIKEADYARCMFGITANRKLQQSIGLNLLQSDAQMGRESTALARGKSREQIEADNDYINSFRAIIASNNEARIRQEWPNVPAEARIDLMEQMRGATCFNQVAMKIAQRHPALPQPAPHESFAITPGWASTLRMTSREYNLRESALARKSAKLHNAANDATECLLILPTATKVEWGTDGKYKMVNTCSGRVAASWCSNAEECNAGHGNLWTLRPGQEWPIFFADPANPYIRLGGCKVDGAVPLPSDAAISRQGGVNTRHNDPPTAVGVQKLPGHICE